MDGDWRWTRYDVIRFVPRSPCRELRTSETRPRVRIADHPLHHDRWGQSRDAQNISFASSLVPSRQVLFAVSRSSPASQPPPPPESSASLINKLPPTPVHTSQPILHPETELGLVVLPRTPWNFPRVNHKLNSPGPRKLWIPTRGEHRPGIEPSTSTERQIER